MTFELKGLLPARSCGGFTACCKTHEVEVIEKPAGKWCSHCQIGKGCGIYQNRPVVCASFKCQWLLGLGDESHRPDRLKIVLDAHQESPVGELLIMFELLKGALRSRRATLITVEVVLAKKGAVAHRYLSGESVLYLEDPSRLPTSILEQVVREGTEVLPISSILR